jgi:hypothetical protein
MYSSEKTAAMPLMRVKGRSLAHATKVSKPQLACMGAMILHAEATHEQTLSGISKALGVSVPYIQLALSLPTELRAEIASGKNVEIFREISTLLKTKAIVASEPAPLKAIA